MKTLKAEICKAKRGKHQWIADLLLKKFVSLFSKRLSWKSLDRSVYRFRLFFLFHFKSLT